MDLTAIIAKVIEAHPLKRPIDHYTFKCAGCSWIGWDHPKHVAEEADKAILNASTITTVDELDTLPIPTPEHFAGVLIKSTCLVDPENGKYGLGDVYERNTDGSWCMLQDPSGADWYERDVPSADIPLPAVVLWIPTL